MITCPGPKNIRVENLRGVVWVDKRQNEIKSVFTVEWRTKLVKY